MPAGYSQRSLVEKLGIKPHTRIAIVNAPRGYRNTLGKLPPGVTVAAAARGSLSFIHFFTAGYCPTVPFGFRGRSSRPAWRPTSPKTWSARWHYRQDWWT